MAAYRVTQDDVRAVLDGAGGDDLTAFIVGADLEVSERCVPAGYTPARLKEITRWLAAHLYRIDKARQMQSESVGGGSWSAAQGTPGEGLKATAAGRTAMQFDYMNTLQPPTTLEWAGGGCPGGDDYP